MSTFDSIRISMYLTRLYRVVSYRIVSHYYDQSQETKKLNLAAFCKRDAKRIISALRSS